MSWKEDAIRNLRGSLHPVKVELNELDWKSGLIHLSDKAPDSKKYSSYVPYYV